MSTEKEHRKEENAERCSVPRELLDIMYVPQLCPGGLMDMGGGVGWNGTLV